MTHTPQTLSPVRVAVVGVGALGRHHARILSQMEGVELVAVVDPNPIQGQAIAEQHGTRWVSEYTDIVDECDALSLVVPTYLHHRIAMDCLSRNKDLLVEKPMTADVEQSRQLNTLAQKQDRILQVGHIERFNPAFELLCRSMTSVPRYLRAERLSPFPFRSMDIGVIHDLMIHDIELVLHLTGALPVAVDALGSRIMGTHEDMVQARLQFPDGCIADLTASRINPEPKRCLNVWTSTETLAVDLQTRTVSVNRPSESLLCGPSMEDRVRSGEDVTSLKARVFGDFIAQEHLEAASDDALTAELSEFIQCIRERRHPRVDSLIGLQAVQIADQIMQALQQNCVNARKLAEEQRRVA